MAESRQRDAWNHTSTLLAMLANVNRPKRMRAFKPTDFHPMGNGKCHRDKPLKGDIRMLKTVFIDNTVQQELRR